MTLSVSHREALLVKPVLRVLAVDDSAFARKTIRQMLSSCPFIEVVGSAADGGTSAVHRSSSALRNWGSTATIHPSACHRIRQQGRTRNRACWDTTCRRLGARDKAAARLAPACYDRFAAHPCSKTGGWHREDCVAVWVFCRLAMLQ